MNIALTLVVALIGVLGGYVFYSYRKMKNTPLPKDNEKLKILSDQNFSSQIKNGVTLVDFWAEWCMPCKMMAPVLNSVAAEVADGASVGKINIDQHQSSAAKYNVRSIPTLILFKNGKEINRFVGGKSKEFLVKQLNNSI